MNNGIYEPSYVKHLFDEMSRSYERVNFITSFGFSIRWRRQFLHELPAKNEEVTILDLLTGMGETWTATLKRFPNAKFHVLDFSDGMLKHAARKNKQHFNNDIAIHQQDLLNNSLPANYFDFVTCAFGLKTFDEEQLQKVASEVKRVLKPGGRFSFIEISKPANSFLSACYGFYLGRLVPVFGKLLLGNPQEYRMLWTYTVRFNNAKRAQLIFREAGLETDFKQYFFGCATGISGRKMPDPA